MECVEEDTVSCTAKNDGWRKKSDEDMMEEEPAVRELTFRGKERG